MKPHLYALDVCYEVEKSNGYGYEWRDAGFKHINVQVEATSMADAKEKATTLLPNIASKFRWGFTVISIGSITISYQEALA